MPVLYRFTHFHSVDVDVEVWDGGLFLTMPIEKSKHDSGKQEQAANLDLGTTNCNAAIQSLKHAANLSTSSSASQEIPSHSVRAGIDHGELGLEAIQEIQICAMKSIRGREVLGSKSRPAQDSCLLREEDSDH